MLRIFGKKYPLRKFILFTGEGFFLFISLYLIYCSQPHTAALSNSDIIFRVFIAVSVCLLSLYYFDLYNFRYGYSYFEMSTRLFQALGSACIFLGFFYFLFPRFMPGRGVFLKEIVAFIIFSSIWRYIYIWFLKRDIGSKPVLVVGQGNAIDRLFSEIKENSDCGYKVKGVVIPENEPSPQNIDVPVWNGFHKILEKARDLGVDEIIVALQEKRGVLPVDELLQCKMKGLSIIDGETFIEEISGKLAIDSINPSWLIFKEGFQKGPIKMFFKQLIGSMFAFVGLLLSLPVTLLVSLLIKVESEGPVFFKQERVGYEGKTFTLIKFRSMRSDAEKDGAKWAQKDDDRVTKVGKVIRKLRIDEIPQMWNVLKGDMNFVGPRPERPEFVEELKKKIKYYDQRHSVKPGITGWAQINYPYGASIEDAKRKLEYDLYYIKHMSVLLDLYIILKTVKTILFREGSR
ncbi:MAG: TIGR03013 family PEP-CTERM/XrtA system glycosyltransferase [Thermodesulfobacteria bacterium]|nr:TIGR03013 family PEP-CTERM/XrtA system glycosyltransferase [Thermodesulfobacteriota bacterium]